MPSKSRVLICQNCHQEFFAKDYRENRKTKYCSRACRDKARSTRVVLVCVQCGKEFERKKYMENWSQDRGPFCGFRCYGQWQSTNSRGPSNPMYSPTSTNRNAWNWMQARSVAIQRDSEVCRECGSNHRLHVHHVGDTNNHELDNLETLCASCHRKKHPILHAANGQFVKHP